MSFMYFKPNVLAGDDFNSVANISPRENLLESANGLDPADLKSGRVWIHTRDTSAAHTHFV